MSYSRRDFGRASGSVALAALLPSGAPAADPVTAEPVTADYAVAECTPTDERLPKGKRLPFGWRAAAVPSAEGDPLALRFPAVPVRRQPVALRVSVALETRDARLVEAVSLTSRRRLGQFDVRYACPFQPFSIDLDAGSAQLAAREGVGLRLTGESAPLWVFSDGQGAPDEFRPHLLLKGTADPYAEFLRRLGSAAVVQPFGWMEGCVLDGLLDLGERPGHEKLKAAAGRHFALFVRGGRLVYENHTGSPNDGGIYGIEGTLPFAALARLEPKHPLLDLPLKFWPKRADADGCVIDGDMTTSEGAYTVRYPMAVIGRSRKSEALERAALTQLRVRQARLFDGKTFWRTSTPDGKKGNRNWARGIAWQLLGTARTLGVLRDRNDIHDLIGSFKELAEWVTGWQQPDGLWGVFVGQPELTADTAGAAGLAAAPAIGVKFGWFGDAAEKASRKALDGLKARLTPDGFLGGVRRRTRAASRCNGARTASSIRWGWG